MEESWWIIDPKRTEWELEHYAKTGKRPITSNDPITLQEYKDALNDVKIPKFNSDTERWRWLVGEVNKLLNADIHIGIRHCFRDTDDYVTISFNGKSFCYTYNTWKHFSINNNVLSEHLYSLWESHRATSPTGT